VKRAREDSVSSTALGRWEASLPSADLPPGPRTSSSSTIASTTFPAHSSGVYWSQFEVSPKFGSRVRFASSSMSVSMPPVTTCRVLTGVSASSRRRDSAKPLRPDFEAEYVVTPGKWT